MLRGVGGVDDLRGLVIETRELGELARRQLVGQHVAVECFDVGKTHRGVDLVVLAELVQNGGLLVVVARGDDERQHVLRGEVILDHLLGKLRLILLGGGDEAIAVGVGAVGRQAVADDGQHHEDDGDDVARGIVELADERDLRHEAAVLRAVDQRAEKHQKAWHHDERRQQREENGFDEAQRHIGTELELHEEHRDKAADGREAARTDLGDRLAQRDDDGLTQRQQPVLFFKSVAEDDGVVDGQRQLQDACDRV